MSLPVSVTSNKSRDDEDKDKRHVERQISSPSAYNTGKFPEKNEDEKDKDEKLSETNDDLRRLPETHLVEFGQSDFCLPAPRPRTCRPLQEARADQSRLLVAKETRLEERGRQGSRTKGGEVRESLLLEVVSISIYATKEHSSFGIFYRRVAWLQHAQFCFRLTIVKLS